MIGWQAVTSWDKLLLACLRSCYDHCHSHDQTRGRHHSGHCSQMHLVLLPLHGAVACKICCVCMCCSLCMLPMHTAAAASACCSFCSRFCTLLPLHVLRPWHGLWPLHAAAINAFDSGRQLWLAFPLTNNFGYCCMG